MGTSCSYDPDLELIEDNYLKGTPIDSLHVRNDQENDGSWPKIN